MDSAKTKKTAAMERDNIPLHVAALTSLAG
jgi:hypothetical protein